MSREENMKKHLENIREQGREEGRLEQFEVLPPSWVAVVNICVMAIEQGDPKGRHVAIEELLRLGQAVDQHRRLGGRFRGPAVPHHDMDECSTCKALS